MKEQDLELRPPLAYLAAMVEPDNLILVHLRELRADIQGARQEIQTLRESVDRRLDGFEPRLERIEKRLDMMHVNGMKALKSFIGHRTMTERSMASFDDEVTGLRRRVDADIADLKQRIEQLEFRP